MNAGEDCDDPDDVVDQRKLIDQICDAFESEFRAGRRPSIEAALSQVSLAARAEALVELVLLEIDLKQEFGEPVSIYDYADLFGDFPDGLATVAAKLEQLDETVSHDRKTPHPPNADRRPQPRKVDHFRLEGIVGEGSFGVVWKAFDEKLERHVAVKIPHAHKLTRQAIEMLLVDARAAAALQHPQIVRVHEVVESHEGVPSFIVSELISGSNLKEWMKGRRLSPEQAAGMVITIARALHAAHLQGIIHRDLKPANILIDASGQPFLTDFGLAKRDAADMFADTGQLVGTIPYMAPEQARGEQSHVSDLSDIYALGVILFELITGRRPFEGANLRAQIGDAATPAPSLRQFRPDVPVDLEAICLKCLEKSPQQRYPTAEAVAVDLERASRYEPLRGVPESPRRLCWKWYRRHYRTLQITLTAVMICLLIGGGVWWWLQPASPRRWVKFETDPEGCAITIVPLDPSSGEPDPTRIEHAVGRTPVKMRVLPGDYLVVAVLNDRRFHEVLRHVPGPAETKSFGERHLKWRLDDDGCVAFTDADGAGNIKIPAANVVEDMGLVDASPSWRIPNSLAGIFGKGYCSIPAFYVDLEDRSAGHDGNSTDGELKTLRFGACNRYLEDQGKRLPSAFEIAYLQGFPPIQSEKGLHNTVSLRDGKIVRGLATDPWEWTLNKAAPGTAGEGSSTAVDEVHRLTVGGVPARFNMELTGDVMRFPIRISANWKSLQDVGIRGVRSARPRTRKEDFIGPVTSAIAP
ncbi:MAG: serine/threonine-protein kinase [Planctomycetaceae bacterium]|nr:serine/threonine-protein kinase [Planctomycetaceae bacterium]